MLFDFGTNATYVAGAIIDDIQASAISPLPEPGTIGLVGMAVAGLLVRRRTSRLA